MTEREVLRADLLSLLVRVSASALIGYLCMRYISKIADPSYWETEKARKMTKVLFAKLGIKNTKEMEFSGHELRVAANLVVPSEMNVSFRDIGGYEEITSKLLRRVIQPILKKDCCFKSSLASPPKGVLLYGPPGCGKTMIAKALARESGMNFLNLNIADVTDKWYGESNKMAVAVFTLATKIAPCIIFIDEIDCFLSVRGSSDHEATAMMKSIFMSAWDGLITDKDAAVIIIGATNRIHSVDPAILRRMPARFNVNLPDQRQREEVLRIILKYELVDEDVPKDLAEMSEGLSCADLTEVCRTAIVERMNDFMEQEESVTANQKVHISSAYFVRAMSEVCQSRQSQSVRSFISLD